MRIAIPVFGDQVATVFDFAQRLNVYDVDGMRIMGKVGVDMADALVPVRAFRLKDLGVDMLICGAISRDLAAMVVHSGIEVIPFARGMADEVLRAFLVGGLTDTRFAMPGCRAGQRWQRQRRRMRGKW